MFKNTLGQPVEPDTAIFPLITFLPKKNEFKCLGTGFFIHPFGGFVTAKHIFYENDGTHVPTLYGVQSIFNSGKRITLIRPITHFVANPDADIGIGFLGKPRNNKRYAKHPPAVSPFAISLDELAVDDIVRTYAFPSTKSKDLDDDRQEFSFTGKWSNGRVVDYCPDGAPLVTNPCYHTTMHILDGASGGPVLKDNVVVGVNSAAFEFNDGGDPVSFITPISLIQNLMVPDGGQNISVSSLIKNGFIRTA